MPMLWDYADQTPKNYFPLTQRLRRLLRSIQWGPVTVFFVLGGFWVFMVMTAYRMFSK